MVNHRRWIGRFNRALVCLLAALGVWCSTALADGGTPNACLANSIASNFNGTAIPGGDFIWFNSHLNASGVSNGATITFTNQTITLGANGKYGTFQIPDGQVIYTSSVTTATTTFTGGMWVTKVPLGTGGNVFLAGLALKVPAGGFPGGINPTTWTGDFHTSSGVTGLSWQWGAAVYTKFGTNGSFPADYNSLGVLPTDNSDHAGTPENFKSFVIGGARGGGGSNFTGSWSGTGHCTPGPGPSAPSIFVGYADNTHTTFGNPAVGSSTDSGVFSGFKLVNIASLVTTAGVTRLNLYAVPGSSTGSETLQAVIYADSGGAPGALVASGTTVTYNNPGTGTGWLALPFSSTVNLSPGKYWIGFLTGGTSNAVGFKFDSVPGVFDYNNTGLTNPFGALNNCCGNSEDMSLFATTTTTGGGFPSPWQGSPNVTFVGSPVNGTFDSGAIRIDAPASSSVSVTGASVSIGTCSYNPWPGLNQTIPAGGSLILTQTGPGPVCANIANAELSNFDTSESARADGFGCSAPDPAIPKITLTINGQTVTLSDSGQVLNQHGIDPDVCMNIAEFEQWVQLQ
jgi:hypothetical protein